MKNILRQTTIAALLHDFGKLLHRGVNIDGRAHSISGHDFLKEIIKEKDILDAIKYHHYQDLKESKLDNSNLAYIIYLADNISSGADRREIEGGETKGFDKNRTLESVYNLLNNSNKKEAYKVSTIGDKIKYPSNIKDYLAGDDYNKLIFDLKDSLLGIDFSHEYINSLLEICEAYLSYVPSSTYLGEVSDISLYDHGKLTAAFASCILLYLKENKRDDFKEELYINGLSFYKEKAFAIFSCDISGIQQFIYNISSKGALKALRARSFYLEILLENLIDEILDESGLYRSNIIYTGGGHAYLLLPNIDSIKNNISEILEKTNNKLMKLFKDRLFIAHGFSECSANELMNKTGNSEDYLKIFKNLSAQISEKKLRRYNGEKIRQLNNNAEESYERECRICGISSKLKTVDDEDYCENCISFQDISNKLIKDDAMFIISKDKDESPSVNLFDCQGNALYLKALDILKTKELLKNQPQSIKRLYSKNKFRSGLTLSTRLWMGDYATLTDDGALKTFAELAKNSEGINRIGVLRADVDDMGSAFVKGFVRNELGVDKYRYNTLSRTATLSRSLSMFFKYYINDLLKGKNIVIVYSGGDDLFMVGAWNEVLETALDIRNAFDKYSGGTLSLSAGFGIYDSTYPISRMAKETAILEDCAKNHKYEGKSKDSISLFGLEVYDHNDYKIKDRHTYNWKVFENEVLGEKSRILEELFTRNANYGNSFLYGILELIRKTKEDTINIARLAYLLARQEPEKMASLEEKETYKNFKSSIYKWVFNEEERRQLITAIIIFTYKNREKSKGGQV